MNQRLTGLKVTKAITGNNDKKLSPKTVYNLYISVASYFTWTSRLARRLPRQGPRFRQLRCDYPTINIWFSQGCLTNRKK